MQNKKLEKAPSCDLHLKVIAWLPRPPAMWENSCPSHKDQQGQVKYEQVKEATKLNEYNSGLLTQTLRAQEAQKLFIHLAIRMQITLRKVFRSKDGIQFDYFRLQRHSGTQEIQKMKLLCRTFD